MKFPLKTTTLTVLTSLALAAGSTVAMAQPAPSHGRAGPPDVAKLLNLDADRAAKVNDILGKEREKMVALRQEHQKEVKEQRKDTREEAKAIREATRTQLAAVLTPEELKKLDEARPAGGSREGRGPGHKPAQ